MSELHPIGPTCESTFDLAAFLVNELELARTMLGLANTELQEPSNVAAARRAVANAQDALDSVVHFLERLRHSRFKEKADAIEAEAISMQARVDSFRSATQI